MSGVGIVSPLPGAREHGCTFKLTEEGFVRYTGTPVCTKAVLDVIESLEDKATKELRDGD